MPALRKAEKHIDYFYFYPKEVKGFIESCVMSSQRIGDEVATRDWSIFLDMKGALKNWTQAEEEAAWRQGKENLTFGKANMLEHSLDFAMSVRLGAEVDNYVLYQMSTIRDAHGNYAIEPSSFVWTPSGALAMDVYY